MEEDEVRASLARVLNSKAPLSWEVDYRFLGDAMDSLDQAAFVLDLQETNGLIVPDEDLDTLDTIANVLTYASTHL
jgi:acyl carrier protein